MMDRFRLNFNNQDRNKGNFRPLQDYASGSKLISNRNSKYQQITKSHQNHMIAKANKPTKFFKIQKKSISPHQFDDYQTNILLKKNQYFISIPTKKPQVQTTKRQILKNSQNQKKYSFGFSNQVTKSSILNSSKTQSFIQTLKGKRVRAFQNNQKLKRSASMKNLIEKRFPNEKKLKKEFENKQEEIKHDTKLQKNDINKQYDASKYNWRLSQSKEKLEKHKSLSCLFGKIMFLSEFNKKEVNKNKVSLVSRIPTPTKKERESQSSQWRILKEFEAKNQSNAKSEQLSDILGYTFGSDVLNSVYFQ